MSPSLQPTVNRRARLLYFLKHLRKGVYVTSVQIAEQFNYTRRQALEDLEIMKNKLNLKSGYISMDTEGGAHKVKVYHK